MHGKGSRMIFFMVSVFSSKYHLVFKSFSFPPESKYMNDPAYTQTYAHWIIRIFLISIRGYLILSPQNSSKIIYFHFFLLLYLPIHIHWKCAACTSTTISCALCWCWWMYPPDSALIWIIIIAAQSTVLSFLLITSF